MEKIVLVRSTPRKDGLDTINKYLELGWEVKHISATNVGVSGDTLAYVVLEYVAEE
ncbi:MAG: hypothetical protein IJE09_07605 [Oscillospiraceae bacterium]|nr:hypothetical protein [Oscillospiraceae bacterium]